MKPAILGFSLGRWRTTALVLLCSGLGACATPQNADPLEVANRRIYAVNMALDRTVVKPVARAYAEAIPRPVQRGVRNVLGNIKDVSIAGNNLLQAKPVAAVSDVGRVLVNSTVGILGIFDVATPLGLPKHNEDFGQTLGRWGVPSGAFIMLPLLGPSTLRDATGIVIENMYLDPKQQLEDVAPRNTLTVLNVVDTRVTVLDLDTVIAAQPDPYAFLRDAYLTRRQKLVYDGNPPRPANEEDEYDDTDSPPPATVPPPADAAVPPEPAAGTTE
jgi:phospholipid-binding lipoprotein MlaA